MATEMRRHGEISEQFRSRVAAGVYVPGHTALNRSTHDDASSVEVADTVKVDDVGGAEAAEGAKMKQFWTNATDVLLAAVLESNRKNGGDDDASDGGGTDGASSGPPWKRGRSEHGHEEPGNGNGVSIFEAAGVSGFGCVISDEDAELLMQVRKLSCCVIF